MQVTHCSLEEKKLQTEKMFFNRFADLMCLNVIKKKGAESTLHTIRYWTKSCYVLGQVCQVIDSKL